MSTPRISEGPSKFEGWREVTITTDYKADAQQAIKLVQAWTKANGGRAKLKEFYSAPRWGSNLDLFFRAVVFVKV